MKVNLLIIILLWIVLPNFLSAKVFINELMQSNIDHVRDDLQEFPDSWIELYNDSEQAINLQNWTVSVDADYKKGWKITIPVTIDPKSYLMIYADRQNTTKGKKTYLHTDFILDSGNGGAIYLFDANGNQVDAITNIPKQPAPNIAFGRMTDGIATLVHFVTATPGSSNTGNFSSVVLPPPVFSLGGGFFKNSVTVSLSLPAGVPNGVFSSNIHYTLDNTEPTSNSSVYTKELVISKPTVVRAKLIHPNYLTNRSTVHTYIVEPKKDFKAMNLPVISISTDPEYLWDEKFGIYVRGDGEFGLPGNGQDGPVNWNNNWRRPVNFEYFPVNRNSNALNQLCEMRIAGGWTRAEPQKSFIVYGHKRFGIKRFEYDFFKDKPNQEIKSFMIRNSGNDFWWTHFRDAAIQLFLGGKVDVDYQAYQPALFYLNGDFWGIQNLRERSSEDFVLANYGLENDEIDVIGNWWGEVKAGDKIAWDQLMTELRKSPSQRNYEWIMNQVDIDEFINYMILQIYVANTDFPQNNMVMWRPRKAGGKWRFMLKDLDFGLGIWDMNKPTHNSMAYNTENDNNERKLFNALLTQESFKKKFYGHFAVYMGDLLHYKSTSHVIDSIQNILEPAMQDHLTRWMPEKWWRDMNSWRTEVSKMKTWCNARNTEVYKHLRDHFKLGTIMKLTFAKNNNLKDPHPKVFINGVRMRDSGLDASYYQKEVIDLYYEGNNSLYGWEITKTIDGKTTVDTYFQQKLSFQIANGCTSLNIKLIEKTATLFTEVVQPEINMSVFDHQLHIKNLQSTSFISIFDISGRLIVKTATTNNSIIIPLRQQGVFIVEVRNDSETFTQKIVNL